ncbi:MAG: hypothetical protein SOY63_03240 [Alloprevotella sp.]|nr:hypothetical protein [Alloprevotella sp.]
MSARLKRLNLFNAKVGFSAHTHDGRHTKPLILPLTPAFWDFNRHPEITQKTITPIMPNATSPIAQRPVFFFQSKKSGQNAWPLLGVILTLPELNAAKGCESRQRHFIIYIKLQNITHNGLRN